MRKFIDAVQILNEQVLDIPNEYGREFRIYQNPIRDQIITLMDRHSELRGILLNDDIFVWSAFEATHDGAWLSLIAQGFEDGLKVDFYVSRPPQSAIYVNCLSNKYTPHLAAIPAIRRWKFEVV